MLRPQTINVVHNRGYSHGTYNSANIKSSTHIMPMLITMLKRPRVIILNGNASAFNMGFTKKLRSPSKMPKIKSICHWAFRGNPKKLESEYILIIAPGTNKLASHNPQIAAAT